ncbi:MAG: magnesium transporter [Ktedonobacterales bacterium]
MPSLTELLDKPVRDTLGDEVARLQDLVVRVPTDEEIAANPAETYPAVIGLVARLSGPRGKRDVFIPWEQVSTMSTRGVRLSSPAVNVQRFAKREGELVLRGLWDRQVVDVEGRRVVRINDLDLAERNGMWRLVAVDVSPSAALRRLGGLGLENLGKRVVALTGREPGANAPLIDWKMVVPVGEGGQGDGSALQLRVPRDRLALMRPADLAYLLEQLTPAQSADLLETLPDEAAADTLEELEDEQQAQILQAMNPERAADVLEEMEPDEAADALQDMPAAQQADLLGRMDRDDAAEVQDLLGYPEDTAGGIMTTDYLSVPDWVMVGEVIAAMRSRTQAAALDAEEPLPQALPEIYVVTEEMAPPPRPVVRSGGAKPRGRPGPHAAAAVVETNRGPVNLEAEGRLVGIVPLLDLMLADHETAVSAVMKRAEVVAHPLEDERDTARLMADHDLLALPVVDDEGRMLGIVTVDDAIDVILPTAWKKRIPRRFQ